MTRRLLDRIDDAAVPGHGPVIDRAFVEEWVGTSTHTAAFASSVVRGVMAPEEARSGASIHLSAMDQAIERAYAELGGHLTNQASERLQSRQWRRETHTACFAASGYVRGMDGFEVRPAGETDAEHLANMRWRMKAEDSGPLAVPLDEYVAESSAWFAEHLSRDWFAWVVESNGHILGHVFLHLVEKVPSPAPSSKALGYVTNFYVDAEVRNQGLGSRLLSELRTWAEAEGLDTLIVWPSEAGVSAFERAGFTGNNDVLELSLFPS